MYRCPCYAQVYASSPPTDYLRQGSVPPTMIQKNGLGRSEGAAGLRCGHEIRIAFSWHPANTGELQGSLMLGGITIGKCSVVSGG